MRQARAVMHAGITNPRWRGNVPGLLGACATHNFTYLVRGPCTCIKKMIQLCNLPLKINRKMDVFAWLKIMDVKRLHLLCAQGQVIFARMHNYIKFPSVSPSFSWKIAMLNLPRIRKRMDVPISLQAIIWVLLMWQLFLQKLSGLIDRSWKQTTISPKMSFCIMQHLHYLSYSHSYYHRWRVRVMFHLFWFVLVSRPSNEHICHNVNFGKCAISDCHFMCLFEALRTNAWTDSHEIFKIGPTWSKGHFGIFRCRLLPG